MTKRIKSARTRATLNSRYWKNYFNTIQYCQQCGKKLIRRYVREEKCYRKVCASCKAITYINPKVVVGLIPVTAGGKLILMRRNIEPGWGRWIYPGGFVELGESLEEACVRETKEEVDVRVRVQRHLGNYSYHDAGVVTIVYIGRVLPGEKPKTTVEALDVSLFNINEIPWEQLAFRSTVDAIDDYIRSVKK